MFFGKKCFFFHTFILSQSSSFVNGADGGFTAKKTNDIIGKTLYAERIFVMKTAGIIAEYNPFHNGHLYQIEEAGAGRRCCRRVSDERKLCPARRTGNL